jgi:hypothetical protein
MGENNQTATVRRDKLETKQTHFYACLSFFLALFGRHKRGSGLRVNEAALNYKSDKCRCEKLLGKTANKAAVTQKIVHLSSVIY